MLYDPHWGRPTVKQFIRFLKDKNPQDEYDWKDPRNCACAKFYGGGDWIVENRDIAAKEGINLNVIARDGDWTFGALLRRVEACAAR